MKKEKLYGLFARHYHGGIRGLILVCDKHDTSKFYWRWSKKCVRIWRNVTERERKFFDGFLKSLKDELGKKWRKEGWEIFCSRLHSSKCPVEIDWDFRSENEYRAFYRPFKMKNSEIKISTDGLIEYVCVCNMSIERSFDEGVSYLGLPRKKNSKRLKVIDRFGKLRSVKSHHFRLKCLLNPLIDQILKNFQMALSEKFSNGFEGCSTCC